MSFDNLFRQFHQCKVLVIGDVMLDVYWWGGVERISPEAPVPIVSLQRKEVRPGGAANVAINAVALGAEVYMIGIVGNDPEGQQLIACLQQQGLNTWGMMRSAERCTTSKTRIISRNQHMLRLDHEQIHDLSSQEKQVLLDKVDHILQHMRPDVVIFEDYDKGLLSPDVIRQVIDSCKRLQIPICVDPKKKNFWAYEGVTVFKPNLKEVKEGLHLDDCPVDQQHLMHMHGLLQNRLHHEYSLITLSEKGVFCSNGQQHWLIPSHLRNIADVSGAGDTVIATAALVWATTHNPRLMAEMANIAGGLVCEQVGVVPVDPQRLQTECEQLLGDISFFT